MRICIGGLVDLIGAILNSIALNYVAGSVYQMMRGGTIALEPQDLAIGRRNTKLLVQRRLSLNARS